MVSPEEIWRQSQESGGGALRAAAASRSHPRAQAAAGGRKASTAGEIDAAFETLVQHKASAVIIASDPFLTARARQFAVLAARNSIAMVTGTRDFTMAGCIISYGNDTADAYRRAGVYAGRILKGAKPADLPVDRATKFELVINDRPQGPRPRHSRHAARPRRRGDRMSAPGKAGAILPVEVRPK